jgi:hypothetical protein
MYKWDIQEHAAMNTKQELDVAMIVKYDLTTCWCYDADSWISRFNDLMKTVPKNNNFSADLMYKAFLINHNKVEVWKMTVESDKKKKVYTIVKRTE